MKAEHPDKFPALEDLDSLSVHDLRAAFEAIIHSPPSQRASSNFLRSNIAWALQARETKQSPSTLRQALLKKAIRAAPRQGPPCKAGTCLIREWQGHTHEVTVLDKGYRWQGEHYRSLSRIAQEITGTRWSGPRFFGLKRAD